MQTLPQADPPDRPARAQDARLRVMVVDDSAVVRGLIVRMLEGDPTIELAASVINGHSAVDRLAAHRDIDVIVLDIEMPVMDGLTALGKLLAIDPGVQVVMASTLTQHNAEISLRALQAGAADYIPKPSSRQLGANEDFRRELLAKVKTLGGVRRRGMQPAVRPIAGPLAAPSGNPAPRPVAPRPVTLRPVPAIRPDVVAIGCSTGGPQALAALLKDLQPGSLSQPVVITQHMPPMFTAILAEHLQRAAGTACTEARSGEPLIAGCVYIAPGDHHLVVEPAPVGHRLRLHQDPPENFCRPSVDPMLRSLATCFGRRVLAVILTGMGSDGLAGCRRLVEEGGVVVAQDQASSDVWGMPGALANAGLCSAVEPLARLAPVIRAISQGKTER